VVETVKIQITEPYVNGQFFAILLDNNGEGNQAKTARRRVLADGLIDMTKRDSRQKHPLVMVSPRQSRGL